MLPNIIFKMLNRSSYTKNLHERNNLKQRNNCYVQRINELNVGAIKNIRYLLHTIKDEII